MLRILAALLFLAAPAAAHEIEAGDLVIIHPTLAKAFPAARSAAGYMAISNNGTEPDMLIEVRIEGLTAMIHESVDQDGVSRMVHLAAVEVPADHTVLFEQGGLHVMVTGLAPGQLKPGEEVAATLVFERQGEVPMVFKVEDLGGAEADAHAGH